jgi:hypothetical protein
MKKSRKALTQVDYTADCNIRHNWFYDYSKLVYINGRSKVEILCPIHGSFWQKAESHKSGYGCPCCGELLKGTGFKPTTNLTEFINTSNSVHNYKYSYDKVVYVKRSVAVTITCREHGDFEQLPSSHVSGCGCPHCANQNRNEAIKSTTESVIEKARSVQSVVYDYSKSIYLGDKVPMIIGCSIHGDFLQVPSNHLQGQGCPHCKKTGYNKSKPGYLYILSSGDMLKVGITNKGVEFRRKAVSKSSGEDFSVVSSMFFQDGEIPATIETKALQWLRQHYKQVTRKFDGNTECFTGCTIKALTDFIVPIASEVNVETNNCPHQL